MRRRSTRPRWTGVCAPLCAPLSRARGFGIRVFDCGAPDFLTPPDARTLKVRQQSGAHGDFPRNVAGLPRRGNVLHRLRDALRPEAGERPPRAVEGGTPRRQPRGRESEREGERHRETGKQAKAAT